MKLHEKTCPLCNNSFKSKRKQAKYCSKECHWNSKKKPIVIPKEKQCTKCKTVKKIGDFPKQPGSRTGHHTWCKLCKARKPEIKTFQCIDCGKDIERRVYTYSKYKMICSKCSMHRIIDRNGGKTINYTGTDNFTGKAFAQWKSSAKRRGYEWHLTKNDVDAQFVKQGGKCALSGVAFEQIKKSPYRLSLDRIDSSKDYTKDNIQFVCSLVNVMKNKMSERVFLDMCTEIHNHNTNKLPL